MRWPRASLARRVGWLGLLLIAWILPVASASAEVAPGDSLGWVGAERFAVQADSLRLAPGQTRIDLSRSDVLSFLRVTLDGKELVDGENAHLVVDRGFVVLNAPANGGERFVARYRYAADAVRRQVSLRPFLLADQERPPPAPPRPRSSGGTGAARSSGLGNLRINGSKTVSVQGGSQRDATVDQGLNLSIQGQLTEGIGVRAEISDENLPITPEGNTEELSDLDQVRIELYGERGRALLGDFRLERPLGVFLPYERKLQGLWLEGRAKRGTASVLGGAPQGRRVEVELRGREGVQGPYELLDGLRLDQSFIVAGSERVWLDGELLTRGEGRDYTIDYIRGTLRFTERRGIGPENRIAVDFETSASGYRRSVIGATVDSLRTGWARWNLALLREGDDPDRPRDGTIDEEARAALAAAGDDPQRALAAGVTSTAPGEGDYVERFTAGTVRYFELADSTGGDFDVDFRFVGTGQGDYTLEGVSEDGKFDFRYRGPGGGDYTVGRLVPLPESTEIAVLGVQLGDERRQPWMRAELDFTRYDRNQESEFDDGDNEGLATTLRAGTPWWGGGGRRDAGLRLRARAERIERDFRATGRLRRPFFYEAWNLQDESRDEDEDFLDAGLEFSRDGRTSEVSWKKLKRGDAFDGQRVEWSGRGRVASHLNWSHRFAQMDAEREAGREGSRRDRQVGLEWKRWSWAPFVDLHDEVFRDRRASRQFGFRRGGWSAGLRGSDGGRLVLRHDVSDSLKSNVEAWAFAHDVRQLEAHGTRRWGLTRAEADLSWRHTLLPGDLDETTRLARVRAARRDDARGYALELSYRAGTDQSRVLGRQVVFVGFREGDYDAEGNPVGVRQGDYNVVYTPSDSLVNSTEVEVVGNLDLQPRWSWLRGVQSTTLVQIQERSRTEEVGALLRLDPSTLLDPELTLYGERRWREELVLLRDRRSVDLRLSWERRDALDQRFTQGPERTHQERTRVQSEFDLGRGFTVRAEAGQEDRARSTTSQLNPLLRSYDVRDRTAATTARWRFDARRRAALELRWTGREESKQTIEQTVWEVVPSFGTELFRGRWNFETRLVQIEETGGSDTTRPFFFERPGFGRSASLSAQWGSTGGLTVSFRYQVRQEPGRPLRQDLGLETRARF